MVMKDTAAISQALQSALLKVVQAEFVAVHWIIVSDGDQPVPSVKGFVPLVFDVPTADHSGFTDHAGNTGSYQAGITDEDDAQRALTAAIDVVVADEFSFTCSHRGTVTFSDT